MRWPWRTRDREAELDREIQGHLDLELEAQPASGLPEDDAKRAARHVFGNPATVREGVREAWGWQWLEGFWLDARLAVRLWARTPGFSAVAIATIGLGVGASTALVAQVKAVFWTPLPVARPDDLRLVAWTSPRYSFVLGPNVMAGPRVNGTDTFGTFSYPAYLAMRNDTRAFVDVACWADLGEARPVILGELGFGTVQFVSGNYFRTLGVRAALGRTIQPEDEPAVGWSPVVMVSHRFWQRTFGGAPDAINRTIRLNGQVFAIVGVVPQGFFGLDPAVSPDIVAPISAIQIAAATQNPLANRGLWNPCRVVARIAPGRSDDEARADLEQLLADAIAAAPPAEPYDPPRIWLVQAAHGLPTLRDATAAPLFVLLAVVGGLLLAACANIAGLLLARGGARSRELATRLALGATRGRVVRQLLTESLVLSLAGGVAGLVLAYLLSSAGRPLLSQFMPTLFGADRTLEVASTLDAGVLAFGAGLAMAAGMLFGGLPAIRATRLDLIAVIKENAGSGLRRFGLTGGQTMVAAQTALAILLVVGAGLFLRTLANLRSADVGFETDRLLYARIEPRSGGLAQAQRRQFFEDAVARLRALPGVVAATAAGVAPFGGDASVGVGSVRMPICPPASLRRGAGPDMVPFNAVATGYFETMGVSLVAGRDFRLTDNQARPLLIVNEAFARVYFPGRQPVGQSVTVGSDCAKPYDEQPIIGVVRDSRGDLRTAAQPTIFFPLGGFAGPVTLILRTAGDPSSMIPSVRRAMTELNANTPTFSEAPVADLLERRLRRERLLSSLLMVFAGVTMFICGLGIYGMLAFAVERRRQEISVRMAIGAQTSDVIRLMVRESIVPVAAGVAAGAALSMAANRWLTNLLYGVSTYDPLTLSAASVLLLIVALAAAALPSRAAASVNPVLALRQ